MARQTRTRSVRPINHPKSTQGEHQNTPVQSSVERLESFSYNPLLTRNEPQYYGVIQAWGDWRLFQNLLQTLSKIALKHSSEDVKMSISNVATRWVLDFPYVGAVIVGARMGISEHTADNAASFGWALDEEDRAAVEGVLGRSRREAMFEAMGDCGGEYR
jgi:diketogulonate reductase-like aldo/keto reductase